MPDYQQLMEIDYFRKFVKTFRKLFFIFLCNFLLTAQVVRVYLDHANTQATRRTHRLIVYT